MKNTLNSLQYDIVKLFLKNIILSRLNEKPLGGYDLIKFLYEKYRIPLSPGTIYSCLYSMERNDLIEPDNKKEEKKLYRLTSKGKRALDEFRRKKQVILNLIERLLVDV